RGAGGATSRRIRAGGPCRRGEQCSSQCKPWSRAPAGVFAAAHAWWEGRGSQRGDNAMKRYLAITVVLAALLTLVGCAANHARYQREQARLAAIHAAAGKPVNSFSYTATSMYSWEP